MKRKRMGTRWGGDEGIGVSLSFLERRWRWWHGSGGGVFLVWFLVLDLLED